MKFKILFLFIPILIIILSITEISSAEVKISDAPTPEKIQNLIPRPLTEIFKAFNNIRVDFSKLPFFDRLMDIIPKSGEDVGNGFRWLTRGLNSANDWLKNHIGLDIIFMVKKIGEFFVWIFEGIANLIKTGLSFIK